VRAVHALIVGPEVGRRWFIYCAIGFCPLSVENLPHVTFREIFMNCRVQVGPTAVPRIRSLRPKIARVTITWGWGNLLNISRLLLLGSVHTYLMVKYKVKFTL
jgi:hypothetical protein